MQALYTAEALATGDGRNGHVRSSDGSLDQDVAMPKELGGAGGATNPEQLFAAGYAACFHSALRAVARQSKADVTGSTVTAQVGIGALGDGRFGLAVALSVDLPAVDRPTADELVAKAHQLCPYSNATRGNIDVTLSVA
ncbi:organic hydroperoxide resistance protein [Micromonospora sp. NBC_01813]|uniref:organic hydroperoxide resistance protein n=1 Tax=Micromonospora sp. NBC_01813 TaxID=2975988 RepID=UPI002DD97995|nr:organic hydroperoxide resistance protein [Micromonospora sp. NBC_01813]WSA07176.1 organic hydroperoxide resistance protein [Micromonospora sp. NBC_01813]